MSTATTSGRNLFADFFKFIFRQGGLSPFQPTSFAFIDGELHSRNVFGGREKEE